MESKIEPQSKAFKWDTFYYGPEGYDEHVGVQYDTAAELTVGRDTIIKGLEDTKCKPKGGPRAPWATPPAQPAGLVSPAAAPDAQTAAAVGAGAGVVTKVCPKHGTPMRPNKAGGIPGVTQLISKNNKQYTCFWACTTDRDCTER